MTENQIVDLLFSEVRQALDSSQSSRKLRGKLQKLRVEILEIQMLYPDFERLEFPLQLVEEILAEEARYVFSFSKLNPHLLAIAAGSIVGIVLSMTASHIGLTVEVKCCTPLVQTGK